MFGLDFSNSSCYLAQLTGHELSWAVLKSERCLFLRLENMTNIVLAERYEAQLLNTFDIFEAHSRLAASPQPVRTFCAKSLEANPSRRTWKLARLWRISQLHWIELGKFAADHQTNGQGILMLSIHSGCLARIKPLSALEHICFLGNWTWLVFPISGSSYITYCDTINLSHAKKLANHCEQARPGCQIKHWILQVQAKTFHEHATQ